MRLKVLVVEDDDIQAKILAGQLEYEDIYVDVVNNGLDAIRLVPSLIVVRARDECGGWSFEEGVIMSRCLCTSADDHGVLEERVGASAMHNSPVVGLLSTHAEANYRVQTLDSEVLSE